jgi:hypothetical protein
VLLCWAVETPAAGVGPPADTKFAQIGDAHAKCPHGMSIAEPEVAADTEVNQPVIFL